MTDLEWQLLGADGRNLLDPISRLEYSVEEILCGYFTTTDYHYALRTVLNHYQHALDRLPIKEGDKVRVRRRYWYLGWQDNGWNGYAQMFADAKARVTEVRWNSYINDWSVGVTYKNPYRWEDYMKDFSVKDRPTTFFFRLHHLKRVK